MFARGQGMWGHKGEDRMMDTREASSGCGGRGGKWINGFKKDEGIGRSK
jgi:hypothetical protein